MSKSVDLYYASQIAKQKTRCQDLYHRDEGGIP